MVESLGFYPGAFWSPLLSFTEFFGGILIAIGLLTRPASFAAMFILLVTVWFHWVTMGQGYSRCRKVDPVGGDLLLLRHPRRQPPFGRRAARQAVLNGCRRRGNRRHQRSPFAFAARNGLRSARSQASSIWTVRRRSQP